MQLGQSVSPVPHCVQNLLLVHSTKTVKEKDLTCALEEIRVECVASARLFAYPVLHICVAWA